MVLPIAVQAGGMIAKSLVLIPLSSRRASHCRLAWAEASAKVAAVRASS